MPLAANDDILHRFLVHAVDLEKFKAGERTRALRILKDLEDDCIGLLARGAGTVWTQARLRALLAQVRATIATAYTDLRDQIEQDLQSVAEVEMSFGATALNRAIGVDVTTVEFDANLLRAVVGRAVIEGGPQAEWWARQSAKTEQMFADTVRKGILGGQTTDQVVRTLRQDIFRGVLRRNVEALVRTSIASVSDEARSEMFDQNSDVISEVMQHSTLDSRTTLTCIAYSGKRWTWPDLEPIGHDLPYLNGVPRHWGCRSVTVPIVPLFSDISSSGSAARSESLFRRKLKEAGMKKSEMDRAVMHAQASMDGQVPETMDYEEWLSSKPVAFQQEILGPGKWRLWNEGKLSFTDLVDQSGNPLTLDELRARAS